jgi:RNA 2',3'-cyclic 3'-phosphodiesterase
LDVVTEKPVRLFVAIDLDDDARTAIARLQQLVVKALGSGRSFKVVDPAHMHLTLAFLGEIAEAAVPPIVDTLSTSITVRSFAAEFQGLGVFPPRGAPRVLWLRVEAGADGIVAVQREVAGRLQGLGVVLDRRPFYPHLTLARWRVSHARDRRRALSTESRATVARVGVDHVTLYESRLSSAGPTYTVLTRANLT